jgi:hypothetical protein
MMPRTASPGAAASSRVGQFGLASARRSIRSARHRRHTAALVPSAAPGVRGERQLRALRGACAAGRAARACRPAWWRCRRSCTAGYGRGQVMPCRDGSPTGSPARRDASRSPEIPLRCWPHPPRIPRAGSARAESPCKRWPVVSGRPAPERRFSLLRPGNASAGRRSCAMVGAGFEPAKAEPTGLQPVPFDRSGTPPGRRQSLAAPPAIEASAGVAQPLRLGQRLELLERVVLDLADAFARHVERAADLLERERARAGQAEAHLDHLALALR